MKLIDEFVDPNMATAARVRLRIAGIASHVDRLDPPDTEPSNPGETRVGLWVIDDEQHDDAVLVLVNPEHKPRRVYDMDEVSRLEASVEKRPPTARRAGDIAITLLLVGCLLALVAYTAFEFFLGQ